MTGIVSCTTPLRGLLASGDADTKNRSLKRGHIAMATTPANRERSRVLAIVVQTTARRSASYGPRFHRMQERVEECISVVDYQSAEDNLENLWRQYGAPPTGSVQDYNWKSRGAQGAVEKLTNIICERLNKADKDGRDVPPQVILEECFEDANFQKCIASASILREAHRFWREDNQSG